MAQKDLYNSVQIDEALAAQSISSDTTTAGNIIDTQGYESVTFALYSATLTDGTFTPLLQEGDNSGLSDAASVADTDMIPPSGGEASAALSATEDNKVSKLGYTGNKRYVRLEVVSSGTTSGGTVGALVVLGHPRKPPLTTQTV